MDGAGPGVGRIAAGFFHSLVVQDNNLGEKGPSNDVYGFGSNRNHILGDSEKTFLPQPSPISFFSERYISEVGCGSSHSVFLGKRPDQDSGTVWAVGLGTNGRLGLERPRSTEEYRELLESSGYRKEEVRKALDNTQHMSELTDSKQRRWCLHMPIMVRFGRRNNIAHISCGMDYTLALTDRGTIFAWGLGSYGNLGTGTMEDHSTPKAIKIPEDLPCSMVVAGMKHSMALTQDDGLIFSWGHGGNGRLGQGDKLEASLVPAHVLLDSKIRMRWIAAGEAHSASIDALGNVFCWGAGTYGRSGHGDETDMPVPKQVRSLSGNPCSVAALGTLHSLALAQSSKLFTWGTGSATGHMTVGGVEAMRAIPSELDCEQLRPKGRSRVVHVVAGCFHSLALMSGGEVFAWGKGSDGRLGHGPDRLGDQSLPEKILLGLEQATLPPGAEDLAERDETEQQQQVCCGGMHSGLVTAAGDLWLWGSNEFGQLGSGDNKDRSQPAVLLPKELATWRVRVALVAMGLEHSILLTTPTVTGTRLLFSWGRNHVGQLGLGNYRDAVEPQHVSFISDAVDVATGEDHSAAVLPSGEFYTWGSAESGKLGHGSYEGTQSYPRHLRLSDHISHVSCGAGHTAVLNLQGQLFTFGAGWFGRLGHGNMSNQGTPKQVEFFASEVTILDPKTRLPRTVLDRTPAPKVREMRCASYHTCIVTEDNALWCCGRDSMVCEAAHVDMPVMFGRGTDLCGPGKVKAVAVGAHHTMCLAADGELWVWGDNSKGQLGLGPAYSKCLQPARLGRAGWVAGSLCGVAAGYAHSLALLEGGEAYAWGHAGAGRLGLAGPAGEERCWRPGRVDACWAEGSEAPAGGESEEGSGAPEEEAAPQGAQEEAEEDGRLAELAMEKERSEILGVLQKRLQYEDAEQRVAVLRKKEDTLSSQYMDTIQHIFKLWDKPQTSREGHADAHAVDTEWALRELQGRLDRSLCRNLRRLGLSEDYPNLDNLAVRPEISQVLVYYEELIWILQQQPCYLARLSLQLEPDKPMVYDKQQDAALPANIYPSTVHSIFSEMGNDRTRHLFMALIRCVITLEVKNEGKNRPPGDMNVDWIFDSRRSHMHSLMCILVRHPFFRSLHMQFFDAEDEESLLVRVAHWTVRRHETAPGGEAEQGEVTEEVLFALQVADLLEFEQVGDVNSMSVKERSDRMNHLRTRLNEHHKVFQHFVGRQEEPQGGGPYTLIGFIERLQLPEDVKAIFAKAAELIKDFLRQFIPPMEQLTMQEMRGKKEQLSKVERRIFEPVTRLLMTGVFGHILEVHKEIMSEQMLSERFRRRIRRNVEAYYGDGLPEASVLDKEVENAIRRTHFNLTQLGKIIILSTKKDLKTGADNVLAMFARVQSCLLRLAKRQAESVEDDTGMKLTVDLYTSHYDEQAHYVMLKTSQLLNLSNALWLFSKDVVLADRHEEDPLYSLLDKIQPAAVQEGDGGRPSSKRGDEQKPGRGPSRLWPHDVLQSVEREDMMHNFTISHRFLEFHRDLCFCRECGAPVPRAIAPEQQRHNKDLRLLKVYKPLEGKVFDGHTPFLELESILASRTMPPLRAKDFQVMKVELEEHQKSIRQQDGTGDTYALLTELEKGKKSLDLLRNQGVTMQMFTDHLMDSLMSRAQQKRYLRTLADGVKTIKEARLVYEERLHRLVVSLTKIVEASENVAIPNLFKSKALDQNITLRLADVEKLKRQEDKRAKEFDGGPSELCPSASFSLYKLLAKKVVRRMGGDLPSSENKNISFTFNYLEEGGWEVVIVHKDNGKSHMLCSFHITKQEIERMKGAAKCEKREFHDGFVVMSCFSLLQLLARIRATDFRG